MFNAFVGAEAQDQESIRDLVHSALHRENGLLTRCNGPTQWQYDHWEAKDKRNALKKKKKKKEHKSVMDRWLKDALYRTSQVAAGWTED